MSAAAWPDLTENEKSFLLRFRKLSNENKEAFVRFIERIAAGEPEDLAGQDMLIEVGISPEDAAALIAKIAGRGNKGSVA